MKTKFLSLRNKFLKTLKDNKGQGMVEYILLLVVVVGLVMVFRGQISQTVKDKISTLGNDISGFSSQ